jgi:hypothetical protein
VHDGFHFKLCNALLPTTNIPDIFRFVEVRWINNSVLLVDGPIFAKLLGVKRVDASLFHQNGNFHSHGFSELAYPDALVIARENGIEDLDSSRMRLMTHRTGYFTRESLEFEMQNIKWIHP